MERVSIFHQEFAGTHDAETRTHFCRGTWSDLIEVQRQLFVRAKLVTNQVSDNFFMSWAEYERTLATVNKNAAVPDRTVPNDHSLATKSAG